MTQAVRSPLYWMGGKFYSAAKIVSLFPHPDSYEAYCEPFAGALHVLFAKPFVWRHLETINDANGDLINFWLLCKTRGAELENALGGLPYSRALYEQWHASLWDTSGAAAGLTDLERAVRFFYVLRSSFAGHFRPTRGDWGYNVMAADKQAARSLTSAVALLPLVTRRLTHVQIERGDFETIIRRYQHRKTFLYVDPPYIGHESYYEGAPRFTRADHMRLAAALNATPAQVALSYYHHPDLDDWYPPSAWRRVTWGAYRHSEKRRGGAARTTATEMLLLNYPSREPRTLWGEREEEER